MGRLIPDNPDSVGMHNALRRAKQLAELRWTPVRPLPAGIKAEIEGEKRFYSIFLPAWRPQTGANYSAARFNEKYIGYNVSIETYMTALSNPESVLYTRSLHGRAPLSSAYYGTVCSEFVSYVLDMPFHIDCQQWPFLDGIECIDPEPLENLRLCDVLNERTRHTAIITGINRDEAGNVMEITVTESTLPHVQSRTFTPKEFVEYWLKDGYEILRYHKIGQVTYTPSPWVPIEGDPETERPEPNAVLMPDYGDKSNYLLGEAVTLSVFDARCKEVEVALNDGSAERYAVASGKVTLQPERPGFYRAAAISGDEKSKAVEFCVVDAAVATDKLHYKDGEPVQVSCSCATGDRLLGWVLKTPELAKVWGYPEENGHVPESAVLSRGEYRIIALYQNLYGVYSSRPSQVFEVKE